MSYSTDPELPTAAEKAEYGFFENPLMWLFDGIYDFFANIFTGIFDKGVEIGILDESDPADSDGDGVIDFYEASDEDNTDANDAYSYKDTDNDLVPDYVEFLDGTSATSGTSYADSDKDGISDYVEKHFTHTDPNSLDSDGDGVTDIDELSEEYGTDPNDATSFFDINEDGISDFEVIYQENYIDKQSENYTVENDTDKDGVSDAVEEQQGTDINDKYSFLDSDHDGIPDDVETNQLESDANNIDSDGDGVLDIYELFDETDLNDDKDFKDSDSNGISDFYVEYLQPNYQEVALNSFNAAAAGTDEEVVAETDATALNFKSEITSDSLANVWVSSSAAHQSSSYTSDADTSTEQEETTAQAAETESDPQIAAILRSMALGPNIIDEEVDEADVETDDDYDAY